MHEEKMKQIQHFVLSLLVGENAILSNSPPWDKPKMWKND